MVNSQERMKRTEGDKGIQDLCFHLVAYWGSLKSRAGLEDPRHVLTSISY